MAFSLVFVLGGIAVLGIIIGVTAVIIKNHIE